MPKEKSTKRANIAIGAVSISVEDLISIIENRNFSKIKAESNDMIFEGIDDIKKNKALFVGRPSIHCDDLWIDFDRIGPSVRVYNFSEENYSSGLSVSREIRLRKSWVDFLQDNYNRIIPPSFIIIFLLSVVKYGTNIMDKNPVFGQIADYFMMALSVIMILMFLVWTYVLFIRRAVFYRPSEGFIRRNLEKVILALVSALIGAGIKAWLG